MSKIPGILKRCYESAVVWSWAFNGFRVAFGLAVLPLLWWYLPEGDLGMYFILLRLMALVPIIDFGFSATVGRNVSYAMGGASRLAAHGVPPPGESSGPNQVLLWKLLFTYRYLYRYLAMAAFVLLATFGTYNVALNVAETESPLRTWLAWTAALLAGTLEIYFGWWNVFLRGMNRVLVAARLAVLGYSVQLVLACSLLIAGWGLLSVPLATLVGTALQRSLSRRCCLNFLGERHTPPPRAELKSMLGLLWPNTWRVGLKLLSIYIGITAPQLIFAAWVGSAVYAAFGISYQLITICMTMAAVWTLVKWPYVGQLRARRDPGAIQRVLWPRMWLQSFTYLALSAAVVYIAPALLEIISPEKSMLPASLLWLLAFYGLLELQFAFWTTLLTTENRVPSLWPTVATNFVSLILFLALTYFFAMGEAALVISPLLAGLLFNYWYWPVAGARNLGTTWFHFMFRKP